MSTAPIHYSDLQLLMKLFLGSTHQPIVFDPMGRLNMDVQTHEEVDGHSNVLVNLGNELTEYKGISLDEFDVIIDFGAAKSEAHGEQRSFRFLNHPSGSMRWLFQGRKLSSVLPFYNASGVRAKCIAALLKGASALGLGGLVSHGKFTIQAKTTLKLDQLVSKYSEGYSVFMGTPGLQRSMVVALPSRGGSARFLKVPATSQAAELLQKEKQNLQSAQAKSFQWIKTPKVEAVEHSDLLLTENVNSKGSKRSGLFTTLHAHATAEFFEQSRCLMLLENSPFWEHAKNNLWKAKQVTNPALRALVPTLEKVMAQVSEGQFVSNTMAHGDFTPWNMFVDQDKLAVYDWELSRPLAPAFYDVFHFHYQQGILVDRIDLATIKNRIQEAFQQTALARLVEVHGIDLADYHRFYLASTAAYFINVYDGQELTVQNEWQLATWKEAMEAELTAHKVVATDCRKQFITELNAQLADIPHAFLKFDFASIDLIPESSDLDIAIDHKGLNQILEYCEQHPLVNRVKRHRKSFMNVLELYFTDGSFLSIDLIHKMMRKHLMMLNMEVLLAGASRLESGVYTPTLKHDLAYALAFYALNGTSVPVRYYGHFKTHDAAESAETLDFINKSFGTSFERMEEVFTKGLEAIPHVKRSLSKQPYMAQLKGAANYLLDTARSFFGNKGFIVTFSGVDGVGKSTVIQEVKTKIEDKYRREVVLLRHRPGVLPILSAIRHGRAKAEEIAGTTLPRKGGNRSLLSSILRFGYYYTDYLIGQVYVNLRYVSRGKIVLYDRYYFDFINDAQRSNIRLNPGIAKALYRWVTKPRLNIFLYADAQTIRRRKQELETADIISMSSGYRSLFNDLDSQSKHSRYRAIENVKLEATVNAILLELQDVA